MKTGYKIRNFYDLYDSYTGKLLYSCLTAMEIANDFCIPVSQVRSSCKRGHKLARRYRVVKSNKVRDDVENNPISVELKTFEEDWDNTCKKLHSVLVTLGLSIKLKGCKELD